MIKKYIGYEVIHGKAMINLERIKKLAIEIHGELTFEVKESPSSGEIFTKFYELHMFQDIDTTEQHSSEATEAV